MTQFGRYTNLEEVGRGGFAIVYKAYDPKLNRHVALKVLHAGYSSDANFIERFHKEAQTVANLQHPNIVTIYDFGEEDRQLFLAMEYLSGGDLQKWLTHKSEPLTVDEALLFLIPIANALDYAHKQRLVHRDIKPSNILLQKTGDEYRIVLTDFGLVKAMENSVVLTMTNMALGSPEYMAPEQADPNRNNEIGPHTDLYAFGIVAYQMLTGRVPFPGQTSSTLYAQEYKPVPLPQELNKALTETVAEILVKMLAKPPADRYPKAQAFVRALQDSMQTTTQNQQLQTRITPMYEKLLVAKENNSWLEVITLASQIDMLQPNYKDVTILQAEARQALQAPNSPIHLSSSTTEKRQGTLTLSKGKGQNRDGGEKGQKQEMSVWLKWGGIILGLLIIFGGGYVLFGGGKKTDDMLAISEIIEPTNQEILVEVAESTTIVEPTIDSNTPPQDAVLGDSWQRPADNMTMVYVPSGSFLMGSNDGEDDEQPIHEVILDAFWIDQTEVTNEQFAQFVAANNYMTTAEQKGFGYILTGVRWTYTVGADWQHPNGPDSDLTGLSQHPVVFVSWDDADAYCTWTGGELPSEAQWEYAARGNKNLMYPWGNEFEGESLNFCDTNCPFDWRADTVDDGYELTAAVRSYPQGDSWVGVSDMAGNVQEWVNDWYDYNYYANSIGKNPTGPQNGEVKVLRGGGWDEIANISLSFRRRNDLPYSRRHTVGFRCKVSAQ